MNIDKRQNNENEFPLFYNQMFNPHQLLKNRYTTPSTEPAIIPSSRVVIDRMTDHSKSRWDEPISVPEVLYMKFKVPAPSSSSQKQPNRYPLSLIDFIKQSYEKCKDEAQSKYMENELKAILSKYEKDYHAVDWNTMPLPSLGQQKKVRQYVLQGTPSIVKQSSLGKKQVVSLPKQHHHRLNKEQEQELTKTKMKVNKTLQKLEEKLNKKEVQEPTKTFIGFKKQHDQYQPPKIGSNISPGLRVVLNPPPPPKPATIPPPPPPPKAGNDNKKSGKSNPLDQKFSRSSDRPIQVVTSTAPEPIHGQKGHKYERERPSGKGAGNGAKGKEKVTITKKELTQISKVAQKVSDLHQVAKRYQSFNKLKQEQIKAIEEYDQDIQNDQIIVGRNKNIDKPYLRITGRPDPETIRPEPILKKALAHFIDGYKKGSVSYDLLISQLKSIRQDLTVQHIRNTFMVEVYEQNFKISLFENDIISVKNCQANLWELYNEGLFRSKELRSKYISYHFVSLILEEKYKQLEYMLTLLPDSSIDNIDIENSLRLKQIYMLGNYRAFFDYYNKRDNICRQLLNIYIDKVRMRCLVMFSKTCGQKITFRLLGETIGQDQDLLQTLATGQGASIRQGFFMLKQSYPKLSKSDFLVTKKVTNLLV